MFLFRLVLCVCVILILAGCSGQSIATKKSEVVVVPDKRLATKIFFGGETEGCQLSTVEASESPALVGALIAAVVPHVIDYGTEAFSAYLDKLTSARTSDPTVRIASGYLYELGSDEKPVPFQCLTIVRGVFGHPPQGGTSNTKLDPAGRFSADALDALGLADYPELYLEFHVETSPSSQAFDIRLAPKVVYFRETAARDPGRGKKNIDLAIALFTSTRDVTDRDSSTFAVIPIQLRDVLIGSDTPPELLDFDNPWIPISAPTTEEINVAKAFLEEGISPVRFKPVNIAVTLQETEDNSAFLEFVSKVFKSAEGDIKTVLKDEAKELTKNGKE